MSDMPIEQETVSRATLARLLGISPGTVSTKFPPRCTWGDALRTLWGLLKTAQDATSDAEDDIEEAERRLKNAKAGLAELELAQARGMLCDAGERNEAEARRIGLARSSLMVLPDVLRTKAGLNPEQIEILDAEIRLALGRLSEGMDPDGEP